MSDSRELADQIERTVTGPMWHGAALVELLDGIAPRDAAAHPIPGAHSIWELVLHITVWASIAQARLAGGALGDPPPEADWPVPPASATDAAWREAMERLRASHGSLARHASTLDGAALRAEIPGRGYSAETMLRGVVEHGTYHGGQIALLRRALAGAKP